MEGNALAAALAALGALQIAAALHLGMRFYPPGEGYAEERRNGRIAAVLTATAIATFAIAFLTWR